MSQYHDISEEDPLLENKINSGSLFNTVCDPKKNYFRYFALFFMCFVGFGAYFCFDNPAALQDNFKRDLKISTAAFTSFYSWYSWPNVILCFFGGFLIDRVFGVRLGAIVFLSIVLTGQVKKISIFVSLYFIYKPTFKIYIYHPKKVICAMGAFANDVLIIYLGRFILGYIGYFLIKFKTVGYLKFKFKLVIYINKFSF